MDDALFVRGGEPVRELQRVSTALRSGSAAVSSARSVSPSRSSGTMYGVPSCVPTS